ncbi:NADPH-dependent FMN reductase [Hymenobacter sp. DG25A]|uniref:NADPH-dependent FMN reductase n=1 Tax=Hymenobacter sp. DG25A TaxID=1385663 RepID=UPI0006BD8346|nr:NADPH-dependent FMN reductase [Hymenobacter sp. DG25A]ALD20526.1 FMN reductase [Hymenobacter sp. DG25A]
MKNLLAICGSASQNSSNLAVLQAIKSYLPPQYSLDIMEELEELPHFVPAQTDRLTPAAVVAFRQAVSEAAGVIICTPEYIFSIPARLKNALEWCVSTTVFTDKPVALLTASANGLRGHEELGLIMKTIGAHYTDDTMLLIQGIKGKVNQQGEIIDEITQTQLRHITSSFLTLL